MPDFQDDHFALFGRKVPQTPNRLGFGGAFHAFSFEPTSRFKFAGQTAPHAATKVQGAIAKAANAIMFRLIRFPGQLEQCDERLLQDVLGFDMAQAQGASIEDQLRRFRIVKRLAPALILAMFAVLHSLDRHCIRQICINIAKKVFTPGRSDEVFSPRMDTDKKGSTRISTN